MALPMENRVTEELETCRPPEAPVEMPYQILERRRDPAPSWLDVLRQSVVRRAPHEHE